MVLTEEMYASAGVYLGYFLLKNFGPVSHATSGRYTCYEDLDTISLEDFSDTSPVCNLYGSNGGPDGDRIKAEKTMAKDDWVL
jgi:hypothetical protein